MAMDRKNKKAAQLAASSQQQPTQQQQPQARKQHRSSKDHGAAIASSGPAPSTTTTRNPLLSGSTAPTRSVHTTGGPPPRMPNLKANISPSAPAPPLKDTDFATFGLDVDDGSIAKLPSAPALPHTSPQHDSRIVVEEDDEDEETKEQVEKKAFVDAKTQVNAKDVVEAKQTPPAESTPLPLSTPSGARRTHIPSRPSRDFGPIGSPPRSSPHANPNLNGFSPSTSPPSAPFAVTSPFSAPGNSQSIYTISSPPTSCTADFKARSGIAASLGATRGGWSDFARDPVVEDEDLEEFVPSSLSELLSPSEHSRRMSRTHSSQHRPIPNNSAIGPSVLNDGISSTRHHYSRSVPAPSLLGDIASIWASPSDANPLPATSSGLGLGIGGSHIGGTSSSSFKSSSNTFGGRSLDLGAEPNASLLSPSNASAAFLPGLHHHYLNRSGIGGVQRSISGGDTRTGTSPGTLQAHSNFSGHDSGFGGSTSNGMGSTTFSPPRLNAFGSRPPFSSHDTYSQHLPSTSSSQLHSAQDSSVLYSNPQTAISPSARALQAHAPGQSLPQGLAAGYSRIHALPPLPNLPSPAFNGVGSPGTGGGVSGSPGGSTGLDRNVEWLGVGKGPEHPSAESSSNSGGSTGLETMFSRLSYSAAATSRSSQPSNLSMVSSSTTLASTTPMTMRNPSGGKHWHSGTGGPLSPLSGPVVTGDDDDLFSMDG